MAQKGTQKQHVTINNFQFKNRRSVIIKRFFSHSVEGTFPGQWSRGVVIHTHCVVPLAILQFLLTSPLRNRHKFLSLSHSELSGPCL